jgi:glycosyltransferase involved in cell wall biosynthesis
VASFVKAEHRGRIKYEQFPELSIRTKRYPALPGGVARRLTNKAIDYCVTQHLKREFSTRRPDAIHVHTEALAPAAVSFGNANGVPVIVTIHGEHTDSGYLFANGQRDRFQVALARADRVVIVGESLRGYAAMLADRDDHIELVWNGVWPPETVRRVPDPDAAAVEFITVANLQEGKGVELLLSALAALEGEANRNWRLRIIGGGPWHERLVDQALRDNIADKVIFMGRMQNHEVFSELAKSDVFVLPSYREAFGVAYLEAMASGLATIGVRGQGPSQFIIDGKNGYLTEPRDLDSLTKLLRWVLTTNRREWREVAIQGSVDARQCSWNAHAATLLRLFAEVVVESRRVQGACL